ncbi:MAG: Smr/MutS family protein [Bacteroidaceae bacterium]|nr:Smr/MutS family protein [Bacteroidaceae bacterium]
MIYPNNFEQKISFDKIREMLTSLCLCTLGGQRVQEMGFSTDVQKIRREIGQTMEFVGIIQEDNFPDENFFDVRQSLKHARIDNTYMEVQELFDLQRSLYTICLIVNFLKKLDNGEEQENAEEEGIAPENIPYKYRLLHALSEEVHTYPQLVKRIDQILDKFGNVKDSASPQLMSIRHELAATTGSISRTLANIMKAAKNDGLVDKDVAPTLRDGRLVIPVAPAMKRKIRGIVHDESDTGRTIYIEPAEVVEANNRIRELEAEERHEIKRILLEFTATLRPEIPEILHSYEFLADIDFIRAKAKFSVLTNSIEPRITNKQIIDWSLAVHPILQQKFRKENTAEVRSGEREKKVVPLDICIGGKNRILLISGPNAGGKSVCLKTTGLLQYMLQCGLPVPMAKSSVTGIFRNIFIDIGDEQSIENDLSTYSSHLLNMKNMLKQADGATLILIDEFGTGTEPQIGGAIAEAVLKRFNQRHSYGVITTHYQNLKHLAQETDGIINGAMLYDRQQMCPLFQLQIGNPGSSFAVEIARKIGLPEDVIADASEIVGKDYIHSDKYLQDIVRDKRYWEQKRQSIHQQEKLMEQTIERYEEEIAKLHSQRQEIIARAKAEAEELLQRSNARIEQTVREIKEAQAENERTRQIRQEHNDFKQEVEAIDASVMEERIQRKIEKLKRRQEKSRNKKQDSDKGKPLVETTAEVFQPQTGNYVRIKGTTTPGIVQRVNGKEATVAFGSVITNVKINRLEPTEAPKVQPRAATFVSVQTRNDIRERALHFSQDIDVRGMRGEEALQTITYYIDDALVANVSSVRILHGTGNGILKTLIRQYLSTIPNVSSFHDEHIQLGGAGITIVEFK